MGGFSPCGIGKRKASLTGTKFHFAGRRENKPSTAGELTFTLYGACLL